MASTQVRTTLLRTSWAIRVQPLVWQWVRKSKLLGFLGSNCLTILAHSSRAARILAISMKKCLLMAQKNLCHDPAAHSGGRHRNQARQSQLSRDRDHGLSQERRDARKGGGDGEPCLDPHDAALR